MPLSEPQRRPTGSLTEVPGIKVGNFTHTRRLTGCTAVLCEGGAVAGVDVRGGGPGTREIELLRPEMSVERVHAIVLAGGSAYGLSAADGVMRYLEQKGIGYRAGEAIVPIVPAAILFDLRGDDWHIRPDAAAGFEAAKAATNAPVAQGNVGAGAGAVVGKMLGGRPMKGGLGSASLRFDDGLVVGALAAVNAIGDVVDPDTGEILAGARAADGKGFLDTARQLREGTTFPEPRPGENTTLGIVAANVDWTKAQATKVAQMAQDGVARAVRPAHMPFDGDTIFAIGTGGLPVDGNSLGRLGALAADVMAQAIVSAILHAEGVEGCPSYRDLA